MLPIRKINPYTVALTSYYGKSFVARSNKRANSSLEWIFKQIERSVLDTDPNITRVAPGDVFDNNFKAPYIYNGIANRYKAFSVGEYNLVFDHTERSRMTDDLAAVESDRYIVAGTSTSGGLLVIDFNNLCYHYHDAVYEPIGDIYSVLGLSKIKTPVDFTEIKIYNKTIPVGLLISYYIGFDAMLALLDVKYRTVDTKIVKHTDNEYVVRFSDVSLVFAVNDLPNSLIISGMLQYETYTRRHTRAEFNNRNVYFNLMQAKGMSSFYLREIDLTNQLFVDPITKSILEDMHEPTTFIGLLIRASEMLQQYHHPDSQDLRYMRIRGYERLAGTVYKELATAIKQYRNRNISGKSKIEMSPYQIWTSVMKDTSMKLVEDINPIQNLKETEIIAYIGNGGRTKDSMNKASRAYHQQDMGTISEANVDSSDVGISSYSSTDPNFKNLRGIVKPDRVLNAGNLLSTTAMLGVGSTKDDAKRASFASIQNSHVVACVGYRQPYVRTGYETVIANRNTDMFAFTATAPGCVVSRNRNGILVEYTDGSRKGVTLGTCFGKAEGSVYPHVIVSQLKPGHEFVKGDIIAYNSGFYEPDMLDPTRVILKTSMVVKTVLYESNQTLEDSSSISRSVSEALTTSTTKIKSIVVGFEQRLIDVVKVGQSVQPKNHLMILEDEITSTAGFDDASLVLLGNLSKQAPKAKYHGTIDRIEVFYHGDTTSMSESLLALTNDSDRLLADICKSSGKPVITGQVNSDYRVQGTPLALDKAEIRIYITVRNSFGVGDKNIFGLQLKSVTGEVMDYDMHTESGVRIDAVFGNRSIAARIVNSAYIMGTSITLLKVIGKKATQIYRGS